MSSWKRDFASGLVVTVPILVLLFVLRWVYTSLQQFGFPRIEDPPAWLVGWVGAVQVLTTLVVFVTVVFAVGYVMRTRGGQIVEGAIDGLINSLPGLRVVYNASKLAVETALTGTEDLQTPVKLEVWPGMRMTAFKTGKTTADDREIVFLPTAPNITTGFVIEVASEDVVETDESVEEALTRVLSAGFGEQSETGPADPSEIMDTVKATAASGSTDGDEAVSSGDADPQAPDT